MHSVHVTNTVATNDLIQDPIARAYSAWKMSKKMACRDQASKTPTHACQFPSFAEMVIAEVDLLEQQGCAFNRKVCLPHL